MLAAFLHDPLAAWPTFLVEMRDGVTILLAAAALLAVRALRPPVPRRAWRTALAIVAVLAIAADLFILAAYPFGIAYNDHAEPTVTMIAWWWLQGHLLYPDWDRGEGFYGLIYGPLNFQVTGLVLKASLTAFASKLPGVLAGALAIGALAMGLRAALPGDRWARLLLLAAIVMIIAAFGSIGFWNRPEPFLLLAASVSLLCYTRLRGVPACVGLGLLAGLATGFKLTGPLYFIPFALGVLAAEPGWRPRLRGALAGSAAWLALTVVPFLDPAVTLHGYAKYFAMASRHGQDARLLFYNALFGGVLLFPLVVMRWRGAARSVIWLAGGYCVSVLAVGFIGSKPGAGPHHLLPFLPIFAWLATRAYAEAAPSIRVQAATALFLVVMFIDGPAALKQMRSIGGLIVLDQAREAAEAREVAAFTAIAPSAVMGQGDNAGYRAAYHRVQTAFHGNPAALLEIPAFMEMEKAGTPGTMPESLVDGCAVRDWILPKSGEPFSLDGAYVHGRVETIVSPHFRALFQQNYRLVRSGTYFTLWRCVTAP